MAMNRRESGREQQFQEGSTIMEGYSTVLEQSDTATSQQYGDVVLTSGDDADYSNYAYESQQYTANETARYESQGVLPALSIDESQSGAERTTLKAGVQQTRFELGTEGEEVLWKPWQKRLNDSVAKQLRTLLDEQKLDYGLHAEVDYTIDDRGAAQIRLSESSGDNTYDRAIEKAFVDVFRNHPELLKFPAGTAKTMQQRHAEFNHNGRTDYHTGQVAREFRQY